MLPFHMKVKWVGCVHDENINTRMGTDFTFPTETGSNIGTVHRNCLTAQSVISCKHEYRGQYLDSLCDVSNGVMNA